MVGTSLLQRPWLVWRSATFETGKNMQYFPPASAKEVHGRQYFTQAFCYLQFKERGQRKTLPDMNLFSLGHVASVTRRAPEEDKIAWNVCFLRVSRPNIGQSVQWWIMNLESVFVQPKTRRCHKVTICENLVYSGKSSRALLNFTGLLNRRYVIIFSCACQNGLKSFLKAQFTMG